LRNKRKIVEQANALVLSNVLPIFSCDELTGQYFYTSLSGDHDCLSGAGVRWIGAERCSEGNSRDGGSA